MWLFSFFFLPQNRLSLVASLTQPPACPHMAATSEDNFRWRPPEKTSLLWQLVTGSEDASFLLAFAL